MNPILKFCSLALLVVSLGAFVSTSRAAYDLIPLGALDWKYLIGTQEASSPIGAWRTNEFNDATWSTGRTPIGYTTGGTLTGYEASIATSIRTSATAPTWTSVYFRKTFVVTNLTSISGLTLNIYVDDGVVAWINGVEVGRINVAAGDLPYTAQCTTADEERLLSIFITDLSSVVVGTNTLAIHGFNGPTTSSDFHLQASLTTVDDNPPTFDPDPPRNAIITSLPFINILFSEGVTGVNTSDLLINGAPATNMVVNNPNDYTFYFPQPPTGTVNLAWAAAHGIADTDSLPTPFDGGSWTYTLDPNAITGLFVISEFMADNDNGIRDEDGERQDWIEIFNPGAVDSSLAGWYLTDVQGSNKWRFPSHINMTVGANQYLRVWASNKNRTNNITRLHTNFQLAQGGEYLALLDQEGRVVSEFAPTFPAQSPDISYGRDRVDPNLVGFFTTPTPGAQNSTSGANFAPAPAFSHDDGLYTNDSIQVTITIPDPPPGTFQIRYTLDATEPTNNSPLYTGPLTLATNVFVKARVFTTTPGMFPGPVVAKTYFFLDASARDFNSNLPIVIMNTSGRTIAQSVIGGGVRTRGSVVIIDTFRGRSSIRGEPDYIGMAQLEIFGQTSAGFTKQPFNIELNDAYGNDEAHSLLGLPSEADWKMRNPWSDKCLMNDFLAYELYEDMGNYSVRRRMVEVFICAPTLAGGNTTRITYPGSYYGVLCFLEKIEQDRDRVDVEELTPANTTEPEIAGGYIVKKDKDSTGDRNFTVNGGAGHVAQGLKMHEPKPREVTTAQVNWINNYMNRMTEAMYATDWLTRTGTNHYSNYLDVNSWVDQHWIVEFTKQIDGYRISNFMSKKRYGKLTMSPIWDWNLAFGNANYLEGGRTNGWYWNIQGEGMNDGNHIWLRRLLYGIPAIIGTGGAAAAPTAVMNSGDPDFIQKVIDRWGGLRTNVFNGDRLIARIDEIAAELTEAAGRNYQKYPILTQPQWPEPDGSGSWNVNYANQPTYAAIINQMRIWTRGRYNWVDSQFVRAPFFNRDAGPISPGTSLTLGGPAGATIYYTLDGSDPRSPGGNVSPSAQAYSVPITVNNNVKAFARARIGTTQYSWSPPVIASLFTATPGLRITEIMYHPANSPTPSFTDEDFEFIELRNVSGGALNVSGYKIRGGIDFVFPTMAPLAAGQRVVVVNNLLAFSALYNTNGMIIAGEFVNPPGEDNNLDNTGERLVLEGRLGEPIQDFRYDDDWYKVTDGLGFSLVIADDTLPTAAWNDAANWRVGGQVNGTPGAGEPAPQGFPQVVITEALTHTDLPSLDTIELYNAGSSEADVSNWYLSDDRLNAKKFRIPNGTSIPAGGFLTFDEDDFNVGPNGFALSSTGDEVYLASANALGELTGYLKGFSFGAQLNGVTFGRHVTSLQQERFVSQTASSLNSPNAGPRIPDIVISEINYHPPEVFTNSAYWNNSEDEFIEIYNRGLSAVNLYHPSNTNAVWKLEKAVEFDFPPGYSIPAGGYVVLVNFNPVTKPAMAQAFRAKFGVPAPVPILGPLRGDLSNDDETVALYQPDAPFTNENNVIEVPYVLVEESQYSDQTPWPLAADGAGFSLHRRAPAQYSDDPINWESTTPTPGRGYTPGAGPTIGSHPQNATIIEDNAFSFSVTASGPGPYRYQWRKDGANLTGQTGATLNFSRVKSSDSGEYQVLVMNNSGYAASSVATLTVLVGVKIIQQPVPLTVRSPTNVTFTVVASSSSPISYQWRFNGQNLLNETNSILVVNNVTNVHDGDYTVACTDAIGPVISQPARLTVLIAPIMISPSPAAPLQLTAVAGETLNVGAQLHGTLPIFSRWRLTRNSGGTISGAGFDPVRGDATNFTHFASASRLVATNDSGRIIINLTNIAGGSLANTAVVTNAFLTVLADTDGDGIPDSYESANGMNPNDGSDANGDLDGDTSKNKDEYIAGTNPQDPASYLKVDRVATIGSAVVHFTAVANRSYTIQYTDDLSGTPVWQRLADVGAQPTTRAASVTDPTSPLQRYYRLVTPAQP
jgi:hypothetical protein